MHASDVFISVANIWICAKNEMVHNELGAVTSELPFEVKHGWLPGARALLLGDHLLLDVSSVPLEKLLHLVVCILLHGLEPASSSKSNQAGVP